MILNYLVCGLLTAISAYLIFIYGDKTYKHHDKIIICNGFMYSFIYMLVYFIFGILLYFLVTVIGIVKITWLENYPLLIPIFIGIFSKIFLRIVSLEFNNVDYSLKGLTAGIDKLMRIKMNDTINDTYAPRIATIQQEIKNKKIYQAEVLQIISEVLPIQISKSDKNKYIKEIKMLKTDLVRLKHLITYFGVGVFKLFENEIRNR